MRFPLSGWARHAPPGPPVVVFGSGRSGTTWLAQTIAAAGLELVFEPLNGKEVPEASGFGPQPLFAAVGDEPPCTGLVADAFAGRLRTEWTIRANAGAPRRVVKFIRASLLAAWMTDRFDIAPVFVVRNPLSVVASRRVKGWEISAPFARSILRRTDLAPFLGSAAELVDGRLSAVQATAILWGVQTVVPKVQGLWSSVPLVRYEHMCRDPHGVLDDLLPRLGLRVDRRVLRQVREPSWMTGPEAAVPGYDPCTAWRDVLSPSEADEITEVARLFGLEEFVE